MNPASREPNVILILTDDQGWGDLGRSGNTNLETPRIDALAAAGATFDAFFVQPLCAPTRAEILTGRYFPRTGVRGVTRRAECLDLDEVTVADAFRVAGYATGCFGKWHSGSAYPYHPNGRGFDEFVGFCCGHWSHYFDSTLEHNGCEFRGSGFIIDVLTEHAISFFEENRERPFFAYIPFNTPHSPFQVPDRFYDRFATAEIGMRHRDPDREDLAVTRSVLAMCENIDWNVGRLLDSLERLELRDDTIVVYLSDNGPNSWRWNAGMRGRKGSTDEGGVRSPCSLTWPGTVLPGTTIRDVAGAIDLLPTLADLSGVPLPPGKPLDGVSLAPLLTGSGARPGPDRLIFSHSADGSVAGVRSRRYRAGGHAGGLYDMLEDIGQDRDLREDKPDLYAEYMKRIADWRREVMPAEIPERPIPVGYREFPVTYLPAQDGVPEGGITWSSVHPNASFFINWSSPEDRVTWPLAVKTRGGYDVTLLYTCRAEDVGAEIELSCGDSVLVARVDLPFESPLKDADDRVVRAESYEKEFRPLPVGTMNLAEGRIDFRIRALRIAGGRVIDLRAIRLELTDPVPS